MTDVLAARRLRKQYTDSSTALVVLNDLDLTVKRGDTLAIVGTSGVGKTTLLQLLGGLDAPTAGDVFLMGKAFSGLTEKQKGALRNQHLGFVYQFHHLMPEFNALENVCVPLLIRGGRTKNIHEKATQYLESVGLKERLTHRVGELSGGERQRVAIARALVTDPACVLADEPTGNLDERTAASITELFLSLNERLGTAFVFVTHNKRLSERMARTLTLINGQLASEEEVI